MTSFTSIPVSDINKFLSSYNLPIIESNYLTAWNILKSNPNLTIPDSIADYIISLNLFTNKIKIPTYDTSKILLANDKDLYELSHLLTLSNTNKERIIRILGYLHKLNNDMNIFDILPQEILQDIISRIDCQSIPLMYELSSKFSQLNFDNALKINLLKVARILVNNFKIAGVIFGLFIVNM